ncbi:MAG: hypothetical protein OHK0029_27490 [Armatimonadaceae bacterium]
MEYILDDSLSVIDIMGDTRKRRDVSRYSRSGKISTVKYIRRKVAERRYVLRVVVRGVNDSSLLKVRKKRNSNR